MQTWADNLIDDNAEVVESTKIEQALPEVRKFYTRGYCDFNIDDKRVINGKHGINSVSKIKYKWAWEKYLQTCSNHWMPQEVNMTADIALWKDPKGLSDDERRLIKRNLGFFVTADSLAANNIVLGTLRHITAPECRQFLVRQAFEEAIHCYIDGTEILTESGFVDFRDLKEGQKVAQYHEGGAITYVMPDQTLHDRYQGPVYQFKNDTGSYNTVVTPDHRCVVLDARDNNKLKIKLAKDLSPGNFNFPVTGKLVNSAARPFDALDAFLIAYQADGTLVNPHVKNVGKFTDSKAVRFTFQKKRKIERLISILTKLELIYSITDVASLDKIGHVVFNVNIPVNWPVNKDLSWINYSEIDENWCAQFIEECGYWDGHIRVDGQVVYCNTNEPAILAVQTVAHMAGYRSTIYDLKTPPNHKQAYQLYIYYRGEHASGRAIHKTEIFHDGYVHCVGVPTGMIVTRFQGSVVVSGNTQAYQYITESLGLDEQEIFNAYNEIKSIKDKDEFLIPFINVISDPTFKTGTTKNDQTLLKSMIVFSCMMEGLFFYVGFTQILALGRQNKMTGASEQYQYILRDESLHCNFGIDLVNQIKLENPHLWTESFKQEIYELFRTAVDLEYAYAEDTMPRGVLGMNASSFKGYLRFIANRRLLQIGLKELFPGEENPFPWMSEMLDLKKEKNFFETRVIDYQSAASIVW